MFTPHGQIHTIPHKTTIIDFAYSIHTNINNQTITAQINQQPIPLHTKLHNNNIVEIITNPNTKANPN